MVKVSVVMSVYNGEEYIKETINSILDQTFQNFEFIIIDDGSRDNTSEILKEYKKKDKRIKVITLAENLGLTKALNKGIKAASGEYIARIDCGDIALPERLKVQVQFLDDHQDISAVGSWANIIDKDGKVTAQLKYPTSYEDIRRVILAYNPFIHPSLMFRREVFEKIGLYNESLRYAQDYDLMLRIVAKLKAVNLPKVLLNYRVIDESISLKNRRLQEWCAIRARINALIKYGYPKHEAIKLIKPIIFFLIPMRIKNYFTLKCKRKVL